MPDEKTVEERAREFVQKQADELYEREQILMSPEDRTALEARVAESMREGAGVPYLVWKDGAWEMQSQKEWGEDSRFLFLRK